MNIMRQYHRVKHYNTRSGPIMVSWDITNKCNLKCLHCLNKSGDSTAHNFKAELSRKEMLNIAQQIVFLHPEQCCLCGGETLLNPYIYEIVKILSDGGVLVNMVTNGLLLSKNILTKLIESGIKGIQISVDGLGYQHDIFRNMNGAFDKAIEALRLIVNSRILAMVSFCPNQLNYLSYSTYVEYIRNIGCRRIRMMPFLPIGRGFSEGAHLLLSSRQMFEFVDKVNDMKNKYTDTTFEWGDPLEHLHLVLLNKRRYPIVMCISSIGELTITPYIPITVGTIHQGSLKSIWDNGYNKIWGNSQLLNIIRKVDSIYDLSNFEKIDFKVEN